MTSRFILKAVFTCAALLAVLIPFSVQSQDDDDSKAIKAEEFLKLRPVKSAPRNPARYKQVAKRSGTNTAKPSDGMVLAEMGLTIWRYRKPQENDAKDLVEEDEGQDWILERISDTTLLSPGQKVRLGLESLSRKGYLYVVNREEYADGTFGDPMLMFPTQKSIDRNRVEPGRLTYIPSATGKFRIRPSESTKKHVAESLTIIVSPKPLIDDRELMPSAIKLQPAQFNQWLQQWKTNSAKFEMDGGNGLTMTRVEHSASQLSSPLLSQEDPVPQTIYQMMIKPDDPLLIVLPLRFER